MYCAIRHNTATFDLLPSFFSVIQRTLRSLMMCSKRLTHPAEAAQDKRQIFIQLHIFSSLRRLLEQLFLPGVATRFSIFTEQANGEPPVATPQALALCQPQRQLFAVASQTCRQLPEASDKQVIGQIHAYRTRYGGGDRDLPRVLLQNHFPACKTPSWSPLTFTDAALHAAFQKLRN